MSWKAPRAGTRWPNRFPRPSPPASLRPRTCWPCWMRARWRRTHPSRRSRPGATICSARCGGLAVAAGRLLGAPEPELLRPLGAAYGAGRLLRGARALAHRGRSLLPEDRLAAHGLSPEAVTANPDAPALDAVLEELAEEGRTMLASTRGVRLPRHAIAAALPAVLARGDLRRVKAPPRPRGIGDRLAVTAAALLGRV